MYLHAPCSIYRRVNLRTASQNGRLTIVTVSVLDYVLVNFVGIGRGPDTRIGFCDSRSPEGIINCASRAGRLPAGRYIILNICRR
ncbi:hypothetical protein EVAR_14962_1 [Eumeta japonica]|uniref:Uncharacterized protein n=1 Tax=Eumeta variegata TaxID=151549 RepID=A0A4C1XLI8_EUMVA|nr:hypothetical protein EVAR_14962_1 [Eumeta japonica]